MPRSGRLRLAALERYDLAAGGGFGMHRHVHHQLAWSATGVVRAETPGCVRVLPPTQAIYIPGDVPHDIVATRRADLLCVYVKPEVSPCFDEPTAVAVTPLVRELLVHLAANSDATRMEAENLLFAVLQPLPPVSHSLPLPRDDRALDVAAGLLAEPRDDRELAEWGRLVGASARTLARRFVAETGMTFTEWRIQARLQAALDPLAAGESVMHAAHRVGYASTSAFVAAFRRSFGATPGQYFAGAREG